MTAPAITLPDDLLIELRRWAVEQCAGRMRSGDSASDTVADAALLEAYVLGGCFDREMQAAVNGSEASPVKPEDAVLGDALFDKAAGYLPGGKENIKVQGVGDGFGRIASDDVLGHIGSSVGCDNATVGEGGAVVTVALPGAVPPVGAP